MDDLQPKPNIWEANPKLKSLLLILIGVFLLSGIGLAGFSTWQKNYRQRIYEETQAGLPKPKAENSNVKFCIQVITRARNIQTGELKDFPTPCDVPEGWEKIGL